MEPKTPNSIRKYKTPHKKHNRRYAQRLHKKNEVQNRRIALRARSRFRTRIKQRVGDNGRRLTFPK